MVKQIVESEAKNDVILPNDYLACPIAWEIVEDKDEGGFVVSYPEIQADASPCGRVRR